MANNSNRKAIEFMVVSALPPHSTNVLWMDTSIPGTPVLKIFMDGAWAGIWTTVRTEDERSLELLTQVILEQHGLISELTDEVKAVCDSTNTKVTTLTNTSAKETTSQSILQAVENIDIDTSDLAKEATLGASPDTSVSTTIFGWLKSIRDFLVGIVTTNPYAKESSVSNATTSHTTIGMLEDSTNGLSAIKNAIPTVANIQNGLATSSALSSVATDAGNAAADAAAAKTAVQSIIIPTDYAKAGSGTNVTNTDLKNLLNGISTAMYKGVLVVTPQGSGTQANPYVLQPNQWNQFSSALSGGDIYFSKGTDIANITNCYMVRFELAANWSGTSVNFEGFSLEWNGDSVPTWTAGNTYEVNIVDNIAMWAEITPAS